MIQTPSRVVSDHRPGMRTLFPAATAVVAAVLMAWPAALASEISPPPTRLDRNNLLLYRDRHGHPQPVENLRQWQRRREDIVRGMESVMGPLPGHAKRCALAMMVESETDCGAYVRRVITYESEPGSRVPA